jgi:quinoprotein glucose dehydrogenase
MRRILTAAACTAVLSMTITAQQRTGAPRPRAETTRSAAPDQWANYQQNSNFSPLTQITPDNVARLTKAWTFSYGGGSQPSGALGLDYRFEVQPLLIGGVLYISTPASPYNESVSSTVSALEPETGKVLWQYKSPRRIHGRGLAYWKGSGAVGPRLYFATDKGYLMGLDMKTGELAANFGKNGEVDIYADVVSPAVGESRRDTFTLPNPVTVYKNLLIGGARPGEGSPPEPRGDIRAWDATTGKLVWSFHTVPWPGEPGHEDWTGDTWKDRSGCNVWSNLTADESTGLVFGATGDSNHANTAPGMNLYCNSIVALDGATGRLKWYHQLIHHDLWDMDMPTPPILIDVHRDGRVIPAVLQTGKFNLVFIFDRKTGDALYGMEERPVNRSDDPADGAWPVQPFPLKPGPIGRVGITRDDISKLTPEIEKFCTEFWDSHKMQPSSAYTLPIKDVATVRFPSALGGPNWGPLSYDPTLGYVFINLHNSGTYLSGRSGAGGGAGFGGGGGGGGRGGRGGNASSEDAAPVVGAAGASGPPGPRGAAGGAGAVGERGAPGAITPPGAGAAGTPPAAGGGQRGGGRGRGNIGEQFAYRLPGGQMAPCYAPPYGALVAVDVNKGEIAWTSTLGINETLAELGETGLKTGTRNLGGSIATASGLVFIGATNDHRFRAFDAKTGRELWVAELPASGHSTPMTYMGKDGAQYVVIAASGGTAVGSGLPISDQLVAFTLPRVNGQ